MQYAFYHLESSFGKGKLIFNLDVWTNIVIKKEHQQELDILSVAISKINFIISLTQKVIVRNISKYFVKRV